MNVRYLVNSLCGEVIKLLHRTNFIKLKYGLNKDEVREEKIIISLTSYGRRVNNIVHYTLYSLLFQTCKPDKIILWLDSNNWNDQLLPQKLKDLKKFGVDIMYCDDLKSFKKLLPSLSMFPDDIIITCDDDMYYKKDFVEGLITEYRKDKSRIYTYGAEVPTIDANGNLTPFMNWPRPIQRTEASPLISVGFCGCLYKKSFLHTDISNSKLFMKLCPNADDIWFYFMEVLAGTKCTLVKRNEPYPIDYIYQKLHANSSLAYTNCGEDMNDVQFRNVMEYYNLKAEDLNLDK